MLRRYVSVVVASPKIVIALVALVTVVLGFFISLFYLFVAMRNVYQQGVLKTFLKYFSFLFLYLVAFCLTFLVNLIYTTANT